MRVLGQSWEGRGWSVRGGGELGGARSEPSFTFPKPLKRVRRSLKPSELRWEKIEIEFIFPATHPFKVVQFSGFACGAVVKNLPCNAGNAGWNPGWRTKIPHAGR